MILRPPRSTRTDTLFPYTTLFRSRRRAAEPQRLIHDLAAVFMILRTAFVLIRTVDHEVHDQRQHVLGGIKAGDEQKDEQIAERSEERRVGKECVSTCRSRWSPYH